MAEERAESASALRLGHLVQLGITLVKLDDVRIGDVFGIGVESVIVIVDFLVAEEGCELVVLSEAEVILESVREG